MRILMRILMRFIIIYNYVENELKLHVWEIYLYLK